MTGAWGPEKGPREIPRLPRALRGLLLLALIGAWAWLLLSPGLTERMPRAAAGVLGAMFFFGGLLAARIPAGVRARVEALGALDLWAGRRWVALLGLYLLPRLPLIVDESYGADPDAWRVAVSGLRLLRDHTYEASRLPGYPLTEIGLAPAVVLGGPLVAKGVVAVIGFLGLYAFDRVGRALAVPAMGLATLALALSPLYVVTSTSAMDHVPALAALLLSALLLQGGRAFWGGAALGMSAGFRPSGAIAGLPLLIWYKLGGARWRDAGLFVLTAVEAAALAFVPVFAAYRTAFVMESTPDGDVLLASRAALGALGLLPTILLGAVLGEAVARREETSARPQAALLAGGLLFTSMLLFAMFPLQAGYLLPALAAGLLLLAALDRPLSLALLGLSFALALPLEEIPGSLRGELQTRQTQLAGYAEIRAAEVPERSVLLLGGAQFALAARLGLDLETVRERGVWERALREPAKDLLFVPRLPERAWARAQEEGRPVYVWNPFVDAWTKETYGYSPLEKGARLLRGETEAAQQARSSSSWRPAPKEAAARVVVDGELLRISGWSGDAIRACADPSVPVAQAGRLLGSARLKGSSDGKATLRVFVIWEDADGQRVGNTAHLSLSAVGEPTKLNERLLPPAAAASARVCAKLDGDGVEAILEGLRLTP